MPTLLLKFEQNLYESDKDLKSEVKRVEDFLQVTGWKLFPSSTARGDEPKKETLVRDGQQIHFYIKMIYVKRTDKFAQGELTTSDARIDTDADHTT